MGLRIGAVTFGGLSSGINSSEIIEQLVELERRPVTVLESQKSDFEDKRSLLQDLNTRVLTLRNRLRDLDNMNLLGTDLSVDQEFRKFSATSSDTDIAKVTATGSAKPGNLEIQITSLAQNEREISQGYADRDTTTVGTGSFSITLRQGFADEKTIGVTVDSSNNTLDGFVAAINDADPEVRAFVLDDGSANPYRIVIEGANTGVEETLDLDTSGLSGGTTPVFAETQAASDATLILDPSDPDAITINSATNTFASVIQGLTIEAVSASVGTDVRIKVEPDQDEIVTAIQDVVAAYNDVIDIIETQSQVDPTTNRGGPLIGDSTLLSLRRQLSTIIASQIGDVGNTIRAASQIGITSGDTDGKLEVDEDDLREQLSQDLDAVATFFAGSSSFADQLRVVADTYVNSVDGLLIARIDGTRTADYPRGGEARVVRREARPPVRGARELDQQASDSVHVLGAVPTDADLI
jgi:flagellar hook-associated protein 2